MEGLPNFPNLDYLAISRRLIKSVIYSVEKFLRNFLFTPRDIIKDSGVQLLLFDVNVASTVCEH